MSSSPRRIFFRDSDRNLCCFVPTEATENWYAYGTLNLEDGRTLQEVLSKTESGQWIRWYDDCSSATDTLCNEVRILTDLEALCWLVEKELPVPESLNNAVRATMVGVQRDPKATEELRRRRLAGLPTAIVCAYGLRDLYSISYDYPSAFSANELKSLRDYLWNSFWSWLQAAGAELVTSAIICPFMGTKSGEDTLALYAGGLLTLHPQSKIEASGRISNGVEILDTTVRAAPKGIQDAIERIHEVAFIASCWPNQSQEAVYASDSRRMHLSYRYWELVARIVAIETQSERFVGWQPHPLLPLMENLRLRFNACLHPLAEDAENDEAYKRIAGLIDVLLTEPDALDIDEFVAGELTAIEGYFVRVRMKGQYSKHRLTRAEEIFFQAAEQSLDRYKADFDAAQVDFKRRVGVFVAKRQKRTNDVPQSRDGKRGKWAFQNDPPPGSRHRHGPVEGTVRQLATWIGIDERTMKKRNGTSEYHIRFVHGTKFRAWFDSQKRFAEINQKRLAEEAHGRA